MSSGQQCAVPHDVLRMKSPVLRAFPWYTGVVLKLPNFFGKIGDDNSMNVRQSLIRTHSSVSSQLT